MIILNDDIISKILDYRFSDIDKEIDLLIFNLNKIKNIIKPLNIIKYFNLLLMYPFDENWFKLGISFREQNNSLFNPKYLELFHSPKTSIILQFKYDLEYLFKDFTEL